MASYEHRSCGVGAFGAKPYSIFRPGNTLIFREFSKTLNQTRKTDIFLKLLPKPKMMKFESSKISLLAF